MKLMHRRPARPAAPCPPPSGCTCLIHHAITAEEQDKVLDDIVHARLIGETVLVEHLLKRLNSQNCRTARGRRSGC
jgi:predicted MarR family transcription regulator